MLSLLLCLVMALSLLPTVAFAEDKVSFPLPESGYYDASGNLLSETPSDHYVHYDAATKTIKPNTSTSTSTVYVVKKGDTLSSIARKYGKNANDIAKYNHITNVNAIQVGQKIKIPR